MASNWQVSINGASPQSCASLGMTNLIVDLVNMATSTFSFTLNSDDVVTDTPAFAEGNNVVLWNDVVVHFIGTVTSISTVGEASAQLRRVVVSNAWYYLERIVYRQPTATLTKSGNSWVSAFQMSSRVTLMQDFWGRPITIQNQLYNILAYANTVKNGTVAIGNLGFYGNAPLMEARDISCAEAIRRTLTWSPNSIIYFGYGSGATVANSSPRSSLASGAIDLNDDTIRVDIEEINPRYDMNVPGVSLTFVTYAKDSAPPAGDGQWHPAYTVQTAGVPGGEGTIYGTIELGNPGQYTAEQVTAGVASMYYIALQGSKWAGTLSIHEEECSASIQLGSYINILNGRTEWASMAAVVQRIREDIDKGTTTISFGPPKHLSPQDFFAMQMALRNLPPPNGTSGTNNNGTTGAGTASGGVPGITSGGPAPDPGNQPPWTPAGTGGGALVPNTNVGKPAVPGIGGGIGTQNGGVIVGGFSTENLTLCDGSTVKVVTA